MVVVIVVVLVEMVVAVVVSVVVFIVEVVVVVVIVVVVVVIVFYILTFHYLLTILTTLKSFYLSDEIVYSETKNIAGVAKFLMIKMSVGAIVFLGLIATFLIAANKTPYVDDTTYDTSDKTYRGYCE